MELEEENTLFPVFLKLEKLHFLIIGGKEIAEEKIFALLKCYQNVQITVVARHFSPAVLELASKGLNIELKQKEIDLSDFENVRFIIAATANRKLNEMVYREARHREIPVNIADMPDICEFYLGSIVAKGDLRIAISTNGKSPTLAKRLRELFENVFPDEIEETLHNLGRIRKKLTGNFQEKVKKLRDITKVMVED